MRFSVKAFSLRLWWVFAALCGAGVIAAGAAWMLAVASAGAGAVLRVDGPAEVDGSPVDVMRVPLGGSVAYDLRWQYLEGGCDNTVAVAFTRLDGKEMTELRQRRQARPRGAGQPGFEHITRPLPMGISAGRWHYRAMVESTCTTRRPPPILFADFDIDVFNPSGPVVRLTKPVEVLTPRVPIGGPLRYRIAFERSADVPTTVMTTFISLNSADQDLVLQQRPAAYTAVGTYPETDVSVALPPEVKPGMWRMRQVALARFPDGRTQLDPFFEFDFEVRL